MVSSDNSPRTRRRRLAGPVLALGSALVCAAILVDQTTAAFRLLSLQSSDPKTRSRALVAVADSQDKRAFDAVNSLLNRESDRDLLEKTGYAMLRLGDPRGIEPLRRRAGEGPDDWTRAKLIIYAARLAGRDSRLLPWLEKGARADDRWGRLGSAIGLAEMGRVEGGRLLTEWLPRLDAETRQLILKDFRRRIGEPAMQAAGVPLDWETLEGAPADDLHWGRLRDFWTARASPRLIHDVLARQDRRDPDRRLMNRLLHAREYAERWLF